MQMIALRGEHLITRAPLTKFTFYREGFGAAKKTEVAQLSLKQSFLREVEAFIKSQSHEISLSKKQLSLEVRRTDY